MTKLKFLVSLLLALGLVACNGDEDEDKKDDYTLKVDSISDIEAGGDFSVDVKVQKDSKTVTEGDGATLEVAIAVTCKAKATTDKDARTEVKPSAKKATKGEVTITGTAHTSWKAEDTCTAKATADGAKEATGTFKIKAAAADTDEAGDDPSASVDNTGLVSIEDGDDDVDITLGKKDTGGADCTLDLITWKDSDNVVTDVKADGIASSTPDKVFVWGATTNCKLMIGTEEVALTSYTAPPNKVTVALDVADTIGFSLVDSHGLTSKIIFVAKQGSAGTPIVKEHANAASIDNTNLQSISGVTALSNGEYTVWVRHSAGVEKKTVTAANQ